MERNRQSFTQKVKQIQENVALNDAERLEAGTKAAQQAQERHEELVGTLSQQVRQRAAELDKTLYGAAGVDDPAGYRDALLGLAAAPEEQLDALADTARSAGDMTLLRAVRTTAATRGLEGVVAKTVALDASSEAATAYTERQRLRTSGALEAISGAYSPPPVDEQQLRPPAHVVEQARQQSAQQEARSQRVLGGGGLVDNIQHLTRSRRQVGRSRS